MRQTTYVPKQTNHLLHLVLTFATCGAWLPVWACVAVYNAFAKDKTTTVTSGWYGPVARPYEVGPGAPVGGMNPHPPTPGVAYHPMDPLRPYGTAAYVGHSPRKDGVTNSAHPPARPPVPDLVDVELPKDLLCAHGVPDGVPQEGGVVWCNYCHPAPPTPGVPTPPMPPYDDRGSGWTSATRPPSEKIPPYVGYGPGWPVNMARPPALPMVPPHSVASHRLQPFQQDDGLLSCGLLGCAFRTYSEALMAQHRATPHPPASPQ